MSVLTYNNPRRFSRSASARSFPETYFNERHGSMEYPRFDPYTYPMGGPVNGLRNRAHVDRDEFQPEQGARRRIAVACARCRKRKIRCTGDKGDGQGCQNCRSAGVEANQCQFHRVGSDHVQKVMDSYNMVQSLTNMAAGHNMMPIYPAGGNAPYHAYSNLDTKFCLSQLDIKPSYGTEWMASGDDTSPDDNHAFDQHHSYLPTTSARAGSNSCGASYRSPLQSVRSNQPTTSYYSDYGHSYITNGLPYLQTDTTSIATTEPISPLNMSSLQLTLPERPRQRQLQPTELPLAPRRHLPAPQPKPGHGLHHALDHQQDQRLRSSQRIEAPLCNSATPVHANAGSFVKPLLPWTAANENLINAVNEASSTVSPLETPSRLPITATNASSEPFSVDSSVDDAVAVTGSSSSDLNFGTVPLLDPSLMSAPTPPAYSNFRESRDLSASATTAQFPRNSSSSSLYTFDAASRRPSFPGDTFSGSLISGHRYTPLSRPSNASSLKKDSFESQNVPMLRASAANPDESF